MSDTTADVNEMCDVCRRNPVTWLAHMPSSGDTWLVCNFCRGQANKFPPTSAETHIIHHPLT